jgi:molecular chaperone GrpE (heat shock protein)
MDKQDLRNLKKRYLLWLYKTTKEAFDRYERKFTQIDIDKFILAEMEKELEQAYLPNEKEAIKGFINTFIGYVDNKEKACAELRQGGKKTNAEFLFLDMKLQAVEKAIVRDLGKRALSRIKAMYEQEMAERVLKRADER